MRGILGFRMSRRMLRFRTAWEMLRFGITRGMLS